MYGLYVIAAIVVGVAVTLPRREQVHAALALVLTLVFVLIGVKVAGMLWSDPRPFVVDPSIHPAIDHAYDNGFVSDHTTGAAALAGLLLFWRRRTGLVLLVVALTVGWARVAAGVHHWPDVVGGMVVGLLSAATGYYASRWILARRAAPVTAS